MKHLLLVVTGCLVSMLTFSQLKHDSIGKTGKGTTPAERYKKPTSANLPEGTYAKDNKVYIKQGYKAVYDATKKKAAIARINAGGGATASSISGGFDCSCLLDGTDDCILFITGNSLGCLSSKGKCNSCTLSVTVEKPQVVLMMAGNPDHSNMNWKNIEIPKMQQ